MHELELIHLDIGLAAESLLNNALDEDTLDNGYVSKAASHTVSDTNLR